MADTIRDVGQHAFVTGNGPQSLVETITTYNNDKEEILCEGSCNITRKDWCHNFQQHIE